MFLNFVVGEGNRTIYFHEIKHISFHGSVFQATVKLITRALIVIVIPFWGESWRLWARRGEGEGGGVGGSGLERNISWWWWWPIARGVIQNTRVKAASEDARVPGCHHRGCKPHKSDSPSNAATKIMAPNINPILTTILPFSTGTGTKYQLVSQKVLKIEPLLLANDGLESQIFPSQIPIAHEITND